MDVVSKDRTNLCSWRQQLGEQRSYCLRWGRSVSERHVLGEKSVILKLIHPKWRCQGGDSMHWVWSSWERFWLLRADGDIPIKGSLQGFPLKASTWPLCLHDQFHNSPHSCRARCSISFLSLASKEFASRKRDNEIRTTAKRLNPHNTIHMRKTLEAT